MLGSLKIEVVPDIAELRPFRRTLDGWLQDHELPDPPRAAVLLATHEALVNAIEHSNPQTPVLVTVDSRKDGIAIEITDDGRWKIRDEPTSDRGSGIHIIKALVTDVEISLLAEGTTVRIFQHI